LLRKAHRKVPQHNELLFLFIASLAVAYLFQFLCVLGWKLFGTPPFILEEVRSFKYALFPGFVLIGALLEHLRTEKRRAALVAVVVILLVSPLNAVRAIPQLWKETIVSVADDLRVNTVHREYMMKALDYRNLEYQHELNEIIAIVKDLDKDEPVILSDIHQFKRAGVQTLVTYHDKRGSPLESLAFAVRRNHGFVVWHLALRDVQHTLRSDDPEELLKMMKRFDVPIAVTYSRYHHPDLKILYQGKTLTLYSMAH
jgi:hypothetical protein